MIVEIAVKDICQGDTFVHNGQAIWEATADAVADARGAIQVRVQFLADGGRDLRIWDDPSFTLAVAR